MTAPSPFYRQHHAVEPPRVDDDEFRPAWRKHDHLRALRDADEITAYEYAAALCFRYVAEHLVRAAWPAPLWLGSRGRQGGSSYSAPITQSGDLEMLRQIRAALGPFACALLEACLIHDYTWEYLAGCLGVDPRTARAWTVRAIKALAQAPVTFEAT